MLLPRSSKYWQRSKFAYGPIMCSLVPFIQYISLMCLVGLVTVIKWYVTAYYQKHINAMWICAPVSAALIVSLALSSLQKPCHHRFIWTQLFSPSGSQRNDLSLPARRQESLPHLSIVGWKTHLIEWGVMSLTHLSLYSSCLFEKTNSPLLRFHSFVHLFICVY